MGEIIRRDAATDAIVDDARKTLTNATTRGGRWQELADVRLAPVLTLFTNIETQRRAAEDAHAPLNVDTRIYKWNGACGNFDPNAIQIIPSFGASRLVHFRIDGALYFGIANGRKSSYVAGSASESTMRGR